MSDDQKIVQPDNSNPPHTTSAPTSTQGSTASQGEVSHGDIVDEHGHGHSLAAWVGVGVCLLGFLILSLAIVFPSLTWGIIGSVVILLSLVAAWGLAKAGYGVKTSKGEPVGAGRPKH